MTLEYLAPLIVTILVALTGYLATYYNSLQLSRRKDRLDLINKRINEFYGPLYVASQAGEVAYRALLTKIGKLAVFELDSTPTPEEIAEWRVWLESVFMPLNEFREKLILSNAYLIREAEMPECLVTFVTHVSTLKAMRRRWDMGDFSEYLALVPFPADLGHYASESYRELKDEQLRLIGKTA